MSPLNAISCRSMDVTRRGPSTESMAGSPVATSPRSQLPSQGASESTAIRVECIPSRHAWIRCRSKTESLAGCDSSNTDLRARWMLSTSAGGGATGSSAAGASLLSITNTASAAASERSEGIRAGAVSVGCPGAVEVHASMPSAVSNDGTVRAPRPTLLYRRYASVPDNQSSLGGQKMSTSTVSSRASALWGT